MARIEVYNNFDTQEIELRITIPIALINHAGSPPVNIPAPEIMLRVIEDIQKVVQSLQGNAVKIDIP